MKISNEPTEIKVSFDTEKVYPALEDLEVTPSMEKQYFKSDKYGYNEIIVGAIEGETLEVTPKKNEQSYSGVFTKVDVNAIESEELNVTPSEEEQLKEGLFDKVSIGAIPTEEKVTVLDFNNTDTVEVTPTEGSYLKKVVINKDNNLLAENIAKDVVIEGITGIFEGGLDTSDATATVNDIIISKTAYVNGEKITGEMANNGALNYIPSSEQQVIPKGYTSGGKIEAVDITTLEDYETCRDITRTILGIEDEPVIPYKNQLTFIKSTGTQYIDTGITPDNSILIEVKYFKDSSIIDTEAIYGAGNVFELNRYAKQDRFIIVSNNSYANYNLYLYNNTEYTIKAGNGLVLVNDEVKHTNFPLPNESTSPILLFRTTDYGGRMGAFKLYYCKIWKNGALVRNFIPVVDNLNVACLYDQISNSLFYNKGTGVFTAGEAV